MSEPPQPPITPQGEPQTPKLIWNERRKRYENPQVPEELQVAPVEESPAVSAPSPTSKASRLKQAIIGVGQQPPAQPYQGSRAQQVVGALQTASAAYRPMQAGFMRKNPAMKSSGMEISLARMKPRSRPVVASASRPSPWRLTAVTSPQQLATGNLGKPSFRANLHAGFGRQQPSQKGPPAQVMSPHIKVRTLKVKLPKDTTPIQAPPPPPAPKRRKTDYWSPTGRRIW